MGCKDLNDVINLHPQLKPKLYLKPTPASPAPPPPTKGELLISDQTPVRELAALLKQNPFKIIADLMQLGVFANVNQCLDFQVVSQVAVRYGYVAKKSA